MSSQNNFVFSFQQFIQFQALNQGHPYFPEAVKVLFDETYYRIQNPDVWSDISRGTIASGSEHFFAYGMLEGRTPSAFFDEDLYLIANPDVKAAIDRGAQPSGLWHYVLYGFNEGRDALALTSEMGGIKLSALFDESFYLQQYRDVANAVDGGGFSYGYEHFMRFGLGEGRNPSHLYNEQLYLANNPDVKQAVDAGVHDSGLVHYLQYGHRENRVASLLFDPETYKTNNPDVANAINRGEGVSLFAHFIEYGAQEGRVSTHFYEEDYYLDTNPDVKAAIGRGLHGSGYAHFLQWGMQEGRAPSEFYDEHDYLRANPDVKQAVDRGDLNSGLEHYLKYGMLEGRSLAPATANRSPIANNDTRSTPENTAITITVLANDSDPDGDRLSISGIGNANNGSARLGPNGSIVYTPRAGFSGVDTFHYTVTDGQGNTDTATVTVNVEAATNNNDDGLSYANSNKAVLVNLADRTVIRLNYGANFRLMPVGDSITEGNDGSRFDDIDPSYRNTHEGYRLDLQQKFQDLGLPVDFVGSKRHGPTGMDRDHEGHSGKGFRHFLEGANGFPDRINYFIDQARPDVILLMLGTNDGGSRNTVSAQEDANIVNNMLKGMRDLLRSILNDTNFSGQVLIGTIAPAHPEGEWAARNDRFTAFNNQLENEVAQLGSDRLQVIEVGSLLDSRQHMGDPDTEDNGLHPNQEGYEIMADAWYDALEDILFAQDPSRIGNQNTVVGSNFDDVLIGNSQTNVLEGGAGDDVLTGNGGADRFVYRRLMDGFDQITDFSGNDIIRVFDSGFAGNLGAGFNFVSNGNPTAGVGGPTFLYNRSNGILSYDPDGNGGQSATNLLQLEGAPNLASGQIEIV